MEKIIRKIKPKYYWIVAFLLASLAMYVMLSYAQMLTTGKYILLTSDTLDYVSNIRMFAGNILNGESVWYSFSHFLGMNTTYGLAEKMFSPFNIFYILFYKTDVNVITAVIIILKTGLAAATFQIFASRTLKVRNYYSIFFAVLYALCSFAVLYGIVHFIWLDGLYILPIVAFSTEKAARESKYSLLAISYAYIIIVQMYQGFLIFVFSLMYYILIICFLKKERRKVAVWKSLINYLCSFGIAVMISAFLMLPVLLFLLSNHSYPFAFQGTGTTLMQVFNNLFWGEIQNFTLVPYIYCGIPCLLLVPFYFINRQIDKRERITYISLLGIFVVACIFPPLLAFLQVFEKVDAWNYRFAFIIVFLLCSMACKEAVYIKRIKVKNIVFYEIFLLLFFILEGRLEKLEIESISHNTLLGLGINIGFIAIWTGMVYLYIVKIKHRMTISVFFIFFMLFECVSNGCYCLSSDSYRSIVEREEYYYAWSEDMDYVMNEINKNENDFYRMVVTGDYNKNSDAFYGYYGLTDNESLGNERVIKFLKNMGLYVEDNQISSTGITLPMEMLLSVKYTARLHSDMVVMGLEKKPDITENKSVLPIAFMANEDILTVSEMTNNSFENQNHVFCQLSGVEHLFSPIDSRLISRDEFGLSLSEEDTPIIFSDYSEDGVIVFRVSDTENPVYMQITSADLQEGRQNLVYDYSNNMTFYTDNSVSIPFVAKLWQSGDNHYLSLRTEDERPVYFQTEGIYIYELDLNKMHEIEDSLKKESLITERIENGYIKGSVTVNDDRRVLFISVPYENGWKAIVNNKVAQCVPVLDGTFLGIVLPDKGQYEIELKYYCPGARCGGIVSLIGIALFAIHFFINRSRNKKYNEKKN